MSREDSNSTRSPKSKRDSAVGLFNRIPSLKTKRPHSDPAMPNTPIYRLYPTQTSNDRRELRAMENRPDRPPYSAGQSSKAVSPSDIPNEPYFPSSDTVNQTASRDFQYNDRNRLVPSEVGTPVNEIIDDPVPSRMHRHFNQSREDVSYASREPSRTRTVDSTYLKAQDRQPSKARPPPALRRLSGQHSRRGSIPDTPDFPPDQHIGPGDRSSHESLYSQETAATSVHTLPPLQTKAPDNSDAQQLEPIGEDDPRSWDLVDPPDQNGQTSEPTGFYALEKRGDQLFSSEHLRTIFSDPKLLMKFTNFLNQHRPKSIPVLIYYLDALKALRAIGYANAIAEALDPIKGQDFTKETAHPTRNSSLEEKAAQAFEMLVREDLPAYVAHEWIKIVSVSISRRITGTMAPHLREASEGLAEVFCLTDPSRTDNPIVFASEEFTRTTQYGMQYTIGRNCRFLQGPRTSPHSVRRLRDACLEGREHTEVFTNYRRDGSPFMNLLMIAPLMDSKGNTRYNIGAQVDVSGLIKDCAGMDGLVQMIEKEQNPEAAEEHKKDEFENLTEMFNGAELDTVRRSGGRMHREYADDNERDTSQHGQRRLLLKDETNDGPERDGRERSRSIPASIKERVNGKLEGVYQHYLLIRPAPSLRILFTSPSLRVPGILQSPFLNRIGGSSRVRSDLAAALAEGRGVTAKIRWLTRADEEGEGEGRPRWIHCTPLLGHSGAVGVWMIVLVDEQGDDGVRSGAGQGRKFRQAPVISNNINGKEWDSGFVPPRGASNSNGSTGVNGRDTGRDRGRENGNGRAAHNLNAYDAEGRRRGGYASTERFQQYHGVSDNSNSHSAQVQDHRRGRSTSAYSHGSARDPRGQRSNDNSEFSFQLK